MTRTLAALIITISCIIYLSSCTSKNTFRTFHQKKKIHKVYESNYEMRDIFGVMKIDKKSLSGHSLLIFDKNGIIEKQLFLKKNGSTDFQTEYLIKNNQVIGYNITDAVNNLIQTNSNKISNGKITQVDSYNSEGRLEKTIKYTYKNEVNISTEISEGGEIKNYFESFYTDSKVSKTIEYNSQRKITETILFEYNKNDEVSKKIVFDKDSSIVSRVEYKYEFDKKGNWVKKFKKDQYGNESVMIRSIIYKKDVNKLRTRKDIVGLWLQLDGDNWFELNSDGTFSSGYNEILVGEGTWKINTEKSNLTLSDKERDNNKRLKYRYEEYILWLETMTGDFVMKLVKR